MSKFHRCFVYLSCAGLLLSLPPIAWADFNEVQQQFQNEKLLKHEMERQKLFRKKQYENAVKNKAIYGATNVASAVLEIPKNMINLTNDEDSNVIYGVIGGGIKGILDAVGRVTIGTLDVLTAPLPTKQVVYPKYVWDDFDKSNTYGKVFRLDESYKTAKAPALPVAVKPRLPVVENADQYSPEETSRRLDTYFENQMRK